MCQSKQLMQAKKFLWVLERGNIKVNWGGETPPKHKNLCKAKNYISNSF